MNVLEIFQHTQLIRVSDGERTPILVKSSAMTKNRWLVMVWPQLGDFDSLEYAWWLQQEPQLLQDINVVAIGIGDRSAGSKFCGFTGFPAAQLFVTSDNYIHQQLGLYAGLTWKIPGLSATQNAWLNLMVMCAGIGSPGTLAEVLRGYRGDSFRSAHSAIGRRHS